MFDIDGDAESKSGATECTGVGGRANGFRPDPEPVLFFLGVVSADLDLGDPWTIGDPWPIGDPWRARDELARPLRGTGADGGLAGCTVAASDCDLDLRYGDAAELPRLGGLGGVLEGPDATSGSRTL